MAAPWFLLGLALLPAYYYLRRLEARPRRRIVSSLLLWADVPEPTQAPVREWMRRMNWIVALELTAIAGVVTSLAGPWLAVAGTDACTQVVYLDRSASLGAEEASGGRRWDLVRAALDEWLAQRPESGRYRFLTGLGELTGALDRAGAQAFVKGAGPLARTETLTDGVAAAWTLARSLGDAPPLIVTDQAPIETDACWLARGGPVENAGIVTLAAGRRGDRLELLVGVRTAGSADRTVAVTVAGGPPTPVTVKGGQEGRVLVTLPWAAAAASEGIEVRLAGKDALAADDVAWLALPAPPATVWRVGPDNEALDRALDAAFAGRVRRVARAGDLPADARGLFVFDRVAPERLPPGPCVAIDPPADLPGVYRIGGTVRDFAVRRIAGDSALVRHAHLEAARIAAARAIRFDHPERAHVLLAAGDAAVLAWTRPEGAAGPLLVIGFDVAWREGAGDSDWSQLPGFPLFFADLAREWGLGTPAEAVVPVGTRPGQPIRLPPGEFTTPEGQVVRGEWRAREAGRHRLTAADGSVFIAAASLLAPEETVAPGANVDRLPGAAEAGGGQRRVEAWRWPLGLAIAALAAALFLDRRRGTTPRKREEHGSAA